MINLVASVYRGPALPAAKVPVLAHGNGALWVSQRAARVVATQNLAGQQTLAAGATLYTPIIDFVGVDPSVASTLAITIGNKLRVRSYADKAHQIWVEQSNGSVASSFRPPADIEIASSNANGAAYLEAPLYARYSRIGIKNTDPINAFSVCEILSCLVEM